MSTESDTRLFFLDAELSSMAANHGPERTADTLTAGRTTAHPENALQVSGDGGGGWIRCRRAPGGGGS